MESEVDKNRKTSKTDASQKNNNSEKSKEETKDDNTKKTDEKKKDEKVYTGKVFGKGTSRYKEANDGPIIDIDFEDIDIRSPISTEYARLGEKRIKRLLLK